MSIVNELLQPFWEFVNTLCLHYYLETIIINNYPFFKNNMQQTNMQRKNTLFPYYIYYVQNKTLQQMAKRNSLSHRGNNEPYFS